MNTRNNDRIKSDDPMTICDHSKLVLITENESRRRCRHCNLTIKADELDGGYCPECYEESGVRRYDFEEVPAEPSGGVRYRCEKCHAIIESG